MSRDESRPVFELEEPSHFQNAAHADLEEIKEPHEPNATSSSVVHFDARFSTLESGRENQKLLFNNRL